MKASMRACSVVIALLLLVDFTIAVQLASNQATTLLSILGGLGPNDASVLPSWTKTNTECEKWKGLTCNSNGEVTEIYLTSEATRYLNGTIRPANLNGSLLTDLNLFLFSGKLPTALGTLTSLEYLTLANLGEISGEIPDVFGKLTNLKSFNVSGNILYGPIPPSLGSLPNLEIIDVHANQYLDFSGDLIAAMNGTIPSSLASLKLKLFDISQNGFEGTFPAFFKNQTALQYLSISENDFNNTLSSFLPPSTSLEYLSLGFNNFSGALEDIVGELTSLKYLSLTANNFTGPLPSSIGNLSKLEYLDVSGNSFSSLPSNLGDLQSLKFLKIAVNLLVGEFPASLGKLLNLEQLQAQRNGLTGSFDIRNLVNLQELDLSYNGLSLAGGIPDYFGTFKNLSFLALDFNNFTGPIPASLTNIKNLTALYCSGCGLTGSLPSTLPSTLSQLLLPGNSLEGSIPSSICATALVQIDLSSNDFNGSIPTCIGSKLLRLDTLWLYNNSLSGEIPQSLATNPCLATIQLQANILEGPVPNFGSGPPCTSGGFSSPSSQLIYEIDLSNNTLSGLPFHTAITNLQGLVTLSLSFNQFNADNLPASISNLTFISRILCRSCNLIGSLPPQLKKLQFLTALDLGFNSFSGALETSFFSNFTSITSLTIPGSSLSGQIPSLSSLTALANLDLSYNQFSGSIPSTYPDTLISLNFAGNQLNATLKNSSFSSLPQLDILRLDGNEAISGSIPNIKASILTLSNTNISGSLSSANLKKNSSSLNLYNTPACVSLQKTFTYIEVCKAPNSTNTYEAPPFCETTCFESNIPNRYLFKTTGKCVCSGYAATSLTLLLSPFQVLTPTAASFLESTLAAKLKVPASLLWVKSAVTGSDGRTVINLYLFGPGTARISDPLLYRFLFIWSKINLGNSHFLSVDGLGLIDSPNSVVTFEYKSPDSPPPGVATGGKGSNKVEGWVIAVIVVAAILLLAVVCLGAAFIIIVRKGPKDGSDDNIIPSKPYYVPRIHLKEIAAATDDFSEKNKLGSGGYGDVFKGTGPDGVPWAVKRAKAVTEKSLADFENELDILSKVSHLNVVKLLGYCDTKTEQILVYEFMNSGTLKHKLAFQQGEDGNPLTLSERVEIALGAAEGLKYLHSHAEKTIIHRDIKSENILLNSTAQGLQAKIADFGLLKDNAENSAEFMNTKVAGTTGYIDPEYYNNFKVTRKSDVYSFGVVLFELITGLTALIKDDTVTDPDEPNITSLANWVQPYMDDVPKIVDTRLGKDFNLEAMELFAKLAKSCTERFGKYRPHMDEVCYRLVRIKNVINGVADETIGEESGLGSSSISYSAPLPFSNISSTASQSNVMAPLSQVFSGR